MTSIVENFENYVPPKAVKKCVARLAASLPPGNLAALEAIVLMSSSTKGKRKTNRIKGRKYPENTCLGFYHPATKRSAPWIELVVDNIIKSAPPVFLRWRFLCDLVFASTFFHEIGHHLDATIGSPSRVGEQAADTWSKRLRKRYFENGYRILTPLSRFLVRVVRSRLKRAKDASRGAGG